MFTYYFEADLRDSKGRTYGRIECAASIRICEETGDWFDDDFAVIDQDGRETIVSDREIDPLLAVFWRAIKDDWYRERAYHADKIEELAADYEPARPMVEYSEAV